MHAQEQCIELRVDMSELATDVDPVELAVEFAPHALTHSTSWRWKPRGLILTFAHVFPDRTVMLADDAERFSALEIELQPVTCHAIRHLHFLFHTDPEVAALVGFDAFWSYAERVAKHHHPAVAGLLPERTHD
jgi:hypothetical protein